MSVIFDGTNTKYGTLPNFSYMNATKAFTLVIWAKPAGGSTQQFLAGMDQNNGGSTRFSGIDYRGNAGGVMAVVRSSITTHYDMAAPVLNQWNVIGFGRGADGFSNTNFPAVLNSSDFVLNGQINSVDDLVRFIIGAHRNAGGSTYADLYNGKIGGFSFWDRVLTAGEFNSLQAGAHPSTIPSGLVTYLIINGSGTATTMATSNGTVMTFTGSPALDNDTPFPAQTITIVNDGDPLPIGGVLDVEVAGFTKAITKGTIDGLPLISASSTSITLPDLVDGGLVPRVGSLRVLSLSSADDTEVATKNVTVDAPTELDYREILVGFNSGEEDSVVYNFDPPMAAGRIIFYDPSKGVVYADASYEGDFTGEQTLWDYDPVTKVSLSYQLITGDGGEEFDPVIISVGRTRIGGTAAVSVADFPGPVTSGTLDGVALTAASDTSITIKGLIDGQTVARPGIRPLVLSGGGDSATTNANVEAPEGWTFYTITSSFVEAINGVPVTLFPVADAVGDFVIYDPSPDPGKRTRVTDAGVVTNNVGSQTLWLVKDGTKVARSFVVTTGAGAAGAGGEPASDYTISMQPIRMVAL